MTVHTDQNRGETDDFADDCTAGFVINVVDQPGGGGDQTEAAHTAGIAEHKADGQRCHSYDRKNLDDKGNGLGFNTENGKTQNVYCNIAGDKAAKPRGVRCVQFLFEQEEDGTNGGDHVQNASDGGT